MLRPKPSGPVTYTQRSGADVLPRLAAVKDVKDGDPDHLVVSFEGVEWPLVLPKALSEAERLRLIQLHLRECARNAKPGA